MTLVQVERQRAQVDAEYARMFHLPLLGFAILDLIATGLLSLRYQDTSIKGMLSMGMLLVCALAIAALYSRAPAPQPKPGDASEPGCLETFLCCGGSFSELRYRMRDSIDALATSLHFGGGNASRQEESVYTPFEVEV